MSALAELVHEALSRVSDPELGAPLVDLGMIRDVTIDEGRVVIAVDLTTSGCPLRARIERDVREALIHLEGVTSVEVTMSVMDASAKSALMETARRLAQEKAPTTTIPPTTPVIAVSSGKGGVGKSSVTANIAMALAHQGYSVGVLDADIWGFSMPRLLGMSGDVSARDGKMIPLVASFGRGEIHLLSMGLLSDEDRALLWRGLIVQKAVSQFIEDAHWGAIDYLLIDTPPGTGDIHMALARLLPHMTSLVVTIPARAAQRVAARAADFSRRHHIRVMGVIENMAPLHCGCGEVHAIFGSGGGDELARELGVPLVGSIPLNDAVAHGGDTGEPAVGHDPALSEEFAHIVERITSDLAPPRGMAGCSARLLDAVEKALEA